MLAFQPPLGLSSCARWHGQSQSWFCTSVRAEMLADPDEMTAIGGGHSPVSGDDAPHVSRGGRT